MSKVKKHQEIKTERDGKGQKKAQSDLLHRMCCFEMYFSTRKSVRRKKVSFQFFDVPFFYLAESVWRCKRDEHVDAHFSAEKRFNSIKIASIMFKLLHISCTFM